jgi:outer membrane protein, heavy metal efflux system
LDLIGVDETAAWQLASADLRLTASELRVSLSKRQVIPSPTLSLGYARYMDVPDANGASGGALLAGLSLPVPLLDRGQGRIDRSIAEAAEQRVLKDGVALAIRRDVEQAAATLRVRVEAAKRFRELTAPDLPRLRTIAELSYREGRATILELLDAYASHLDAEERRLDLQASAAKAALDLERALGPTR